MLQFHTIAQDESKGCDGGATEGDHLHPSDGEWVLGVRVNEDLGPFLPAGQEDAAVVERRRWNESLVGRLTRLLRGVFF